MRIVFLFTLFLLSNINSVYGQEPGTDVKKVHIDFIEADLFIHSISLPFRSSNRFLHLNRLPGINLAGGIRLNHHNKKLITRYLVSVSAYHQKKLHYGIHLNNTFSIAHSVFNKFQIESGLGIGYLQTFEDAPIYKYKNGEYKQVRDWGRPQLTTSVHLGLSIHVTEKIQLFSKFRFMIQFPFARKAGIFFIPHNRIHFGTRINISNNS